MGDIDPIQSYPKQRKGEEGDREGGLRTEKREDGDSWDVGNFTSAAATCGDDKILYDMV